MSRLERRLQILLDPAQHALLEREAARSNQSVAAVIREAVAVRLAHGDTARAAAADRLLASADSDEQPGEDWAAVRRAADADLAARLS